MSCSISTTPASDIRARSRSFHLRLEQLDSRSAWEPPVPAPTTATSPSYSKPSPSSSVSSTSSASSNASSVDSSVESSASSSSSSHRQQHHRSSHAHHHHGHRSSHRQQQQHAHRSAAVAAPAVPVHHSSSVSSHHQSHSQSHSISVSSKYSHNNSAATSAGNSRSTTSSGSGSGSGGHQAAAAAGPASQADRFAYAEKGYRSSTPPIARNRDRRANSTSTVFVSNTIQSPDDFLTIKSVAVVIRKLLEMGQYHANRANNIRDFDLDMHALRVTHQQLRELTGVDTINRFIKRIFVKGQLSHECNIMALIYIDRLLYRTQMCLTYRNWRHIVLGAYIMASKVWDDLSMINKDFTIVCPMFTLEEINTLEIRYLELLQYHLTVSGRLYAEYYFKLRDVFNLYMGNNGANPFPLKPLSKRESIQLLKTSSDSENCVQKEMRRRRATCDDTTMSRPTSQFILPHA